MLPDLTLECRIWGKCKNGLGIYLCYVIESEQSVCIPSASFLYLIFKCGKITQLRKHAKRFLWKRDLQIMLNPGLLKFWLNQVSISVSVGLSTDLSVLSNGRRLKLKFCMCLNAVICHDLLSTCILSLVETSLLGQRCRVKGVWL